MMQRSLNPGILSVRSRCGSAVADVIIGAAVIVFVIFPVFSAVIEKYVIISKSQIIKDALDMTNISTYNAIIPESLGKSVITFDNTEAYGIYRSLLAKNLNLNEDLSPKADSIAEEAVTIESLLIYTDGFPLTCPQGTSIKRPSIHSCVTIPIKPSLYRQVILSILGREYIELKVHVDSDIPMNK